MGSYGTSTSTNPILEIVSDESEVAIVDIDGNRYKDYNGERYFIKNLDGSNEIEIDSSCTQIYQYAFYNRADITSVNIPDSVTSIGEEAFRNCSSLTSITIPDSVTSIGYDAFSGCSSLTSVTIGDGVTSIGFYAFRNCSSLTSIIIGEGVTSIGRYAFSGCSSLTDVYYSGDINDWVSISFGNDSANPLNNGENLYINGNELVTEANIDTATSINAYAFYGCTSITSVTIGEQVTSIGYDAFSGCSSLTSVTIESNYAYKSATSTSACGRLLQNATEVRVLTSCIGDSTNSYLEDTATFTKTTDGEYTVYTKVS